MKTHPGRLHSKMLGLISGIFAAGALSASEPHYSEGPWGSLEYYRITLDPPATHLWESLYDERSLWKFPVTDQESVFRIFEEIGFPSELAAVIRERAVWTNEPDQLVLEVDDRVIEMMTAENRLALAEWWEKNHKLFHSHLIVNIEGGTFDTFTERFDDELVEIVKSACFRRGNIISTIDRPYLLRQSKTPKQKQEMIRSLFSSRGLVARLQISTETDLESVINYWSAGGRNPDVASIIKGVYFAGGVEKIDIIHLLPPLPKKYLFGYTRYQDIGPYSTPDCFWISYQFFRPSSSHRTLDALPLDYFLAHEFELVADDPQFGDLVGIFHPDDHSFIHSYIHIAGNVVFSKNGASLVRPFVLTLKEEMMSVYDDRERLIFEVYRRKRGT